MIKITCTFFIIMFMTATFASADMSSFTNKLNSMVSSNSASQGAVTSALKLLQDLKDANIREQQEADDLNKTHEAEGRKQIADLTSIRDQAQKDLDDAIAHAKFLDTEQKDTQTYLQWIENRFATLENQKKELQDQRCHSNQLFVKAIKEHKDAQDVIELLKQDLSGYTSQPVTLSQLKDFSQKLSAYSHLFEEKQLQEFMQLGSEGDNLHVDNQQDALSLKKFESAANDRNLTGSLGDKVVNLLTKLQQHLKESLQNLEDSEIKAAYEFAEWLDHTEAEKRHLDEEKKRKTEYAEKLVIDIEVAANYQKKTEDALEKAQQALDAAIAELNRKRAIYAAETARRNDENAILDEVIQIFKDKVLTLSDQLNSRVEDYLPDQQLEQSNVRDRNINQQVNQDLGNLKENVSQEAGAGGL